MKKSILIFCTVITAFSLAAFGFINWKTNAIELSKSTCKKANKFEDHLISTFDVKNDFEFLYKVDTRFISKVSKSDLLVAKSFTDIMDINSTKIIETIQKVKVAIVSKNNSKEEVGETNQSEFFNQKQLKLFQSVDYLSDIFISVVFQRVDPHSGLTTNDSLVNYISIIPEVQAKYKEGNDALIAYFKENTIEKELNFRKDKVQPGKVSFIVTKEGNIEEVELLSSCGYPEMDNDMVKEITKMSGKWSAAIDSNGEKVIQRLVFFFGSMGC